MREETQAVTKPKEKAVILNKKPKGFENFEIKDLVIPRIRLLQGLSKAVTDGVGKLGHFQDSLTNEVLGDAIEIVLIGMKNGAVYFKPGKGMVCKSDDGIVSVEGAQCAECPYGEYWGKFKPNKQPPACSGAKEFVVLKRSSIKENPYPMLLSFIKTSYGMGKRLASMARLSGEDLFARSYTIGSEKVQNDRGTFSKFTIRQNGRLGSDELGIVETWFEMMQKINVRSHEDDEIVQEI